MDPDRIGLWVIARAGKYCRCLAVGHGAFPGRFALETCRNLVNILSDKSNRVPLAAELRLAVDWYTNHESPETVRYVPQVPRCGSWMHLRPQIPIPGLVRFPFISTCLVSAASTCGGSSAELMIPDLRRFLPDAHGVVHIFVDITDLDHVRYCFMASQYHDEATLPMANHPWSASHYLNTFLQTLRPDDLSEPDNYHECSTQEVRDMADELDRFPLVSFTALTDVWPWLEIGPDHSSVAAEKADCIQGQAISLGPASLWDQALGVLVRNVMSSAAVDQNALDALAQFPRSKESLKQHLLAVKNDLSTALGAPALLRAAYAGDTVLDWSQFHVLSPSAIAAALEGPELQGAEKLVLCPDWTTVSVSDLAQAICTSPSVQDVYVMELPSRAADGPARQLYTALLTHPRCPRGRILLCCASACALRQQSWLPDDASSFPLSPRYPILQLILIRDGFTNVMCLTDAFLTPIRFCNGLIDIIAYSLLDTDGRCFSLASHWHLPGLFARASPTLNDEGVMEISPLSAESFCYAGQRRRSRVEDLLPDTWTVLLCEGDEQKWEESQPPYSVLQCAFVRPKNRTIKVDLESPTPFRPEDLVVLDMEGFLQATVPDLDIQSLIALDCRLERLEELGKPAPVPRFPFKFLRAPMDSQTVCQYLNSVCYGRYRFLKSKPSSVPSTSSGLVGFN
ncbi:hypothetical protein VTK26DRAFT_6540 [Humicola hyalothermophila]